MSDIVPPAYGPEELVYVDPDNRVVVGRLEWSKNGNPKPKPLVRTAEDKPTWRKFYPWGTYKSMRNVYRLEGKQGKKMPDKTLDQIIPLALEHPFWN